MQRRTAVPVFRIDLRAVFQQERRYYNRIFPRRQMQRRIAVLVFRIDISAVFHQKFRHFGFVFTRRLMQKRTAVPVFRIDIRAVFQQERRHLGCVSHQCVMQRGQPSPAFCIDIRAVGNQPLRGWQVITRCGKVQMCVISILFRANVQFSSAETLCFGRGSSAKRIQNVHAMLHKNGDDDCVFESIRHHYGRLLLIRPLFHVASEQPGFSLSVGAEGGVVPQRQRVGRRPRFQQFAGGFGVVCQGGPVEVGPSVFVGCEFVEGFPQQSLGFGFFLRVCGLGEEDGGGGGRKGGGDDLGGDGFQHRGIILWGLGGKWGLYHNFSACMTTWGTPFLRPCGGGSFRSGIQSPTGARNWAG